ncbi:twin-arginine translocation signal domain-containing protein, partial [Maribacter dokdonensis]
MKKDNKHSKVVKKSELNKNTFQVSRRSFITKTALAAGAVTIVPRHVL